MSNNNNNHRPNFNHKNYPNKNHDQQQSAYNQQHVVSQQNAPPFYQQHQQNAYVPAVPATSQFLNVEVPPQYQQQPYFVVAPVQSPLVYQVQVPLQQIQPQFFVPVDQPQMPQPPLQQHHFHQRNRSDSYSGYNRQEQGHSRAKQTLIIIDPTTQERIVQDDPEKDPKKMAQKANELAKSKAAQAFRDNVNKVAKPEVTSTVTNRTVDEQMDIHNHRIGNKDDNAGGNLSGSQQCMLNYGQFFSPNKRSYNSKLMYHIMEKVREQEIPCPLTDDEIEKLGLKLSNSKYSPSSPIMQPRENKFTSSRDANPFKLDWQQPNAGYSTADMRGSDPRWRTEADKRGDHYPRREIYHGRNSDGRPSSRKALHYDGRGSYDKRSRYRQGQQQQETSPADKHYGTTHPNKQVDERQQSSESKEEATPPPPPRESSPAKNVWKPRRKAETNLDPDALKYEKLSKEIRGLLNKITPSTYDDLAVEFCNYRIYEDEKFMKMVIDLIFDKAVDEPKFCPLYSNLCKKQIDEQLMVLESKHKKEAITLDMKSFKRGIINKAQHTFTEYSVIDAKNNVLKEEKIAKGISEQELLVLNEEMEMKRTKEKRRLLGIIRFIAQLFRLQTLTHHIINNCLVLLMGYYRKHKDEAYVEYSIELLETVGSTYDQRMKEVAERQQRDNKPKPMQQAVKSSFAAATTESGKEKERPKDDKSWQNELCLPTLFEYLHMVKNEVSNRLRFKIMNLDELKEQKWIPRGGEKGPKTIDEVREEAEKEKRQNEAERIQYEQQKLQERESRYRDQHRERDYRDRDYPLRGSQFNRDNNRDHHPRQHPPNPAPRLPYKGRNSLPENRRTATPSSSTSTVGSQPATVHQNQQRFRCNLADVDKVEFQPRTKVKWGTPTPSHDNNWRGSKTELSSSTGANTKGAKEQCEAPPAPPYQILKRQEKVEGRQQHSIDMQHSVAEPAKDNNKERIDAQKEE